MRTDTHKIGLRAIRNLLAGAKPFEVDAGVTKVTCSMTAMPPESWPTGTAGLVETEDGPWPSGVAVDCRWSEGACRLFVEVYRWTSGGYSGDLCIRVRTDHREVIFVNVSQKLKAAEDGNPVKLAVRFYVTKRKKWSSELADALNKGMRDTLTASRLPIVGKNTAELCEVEVPGGALLPSAESAFRRLIQLALLKLDFIDRRRTVARGKPIVDLGRWLTREQLQTPVQDDDDTESTEALDAAERDEMIDAGQSNSAEPKADDLPLNLILYGPPGTGKTYHLTHQLFEKFRRTPTKADTDYEIVEDLTWVEVTALALHDLGGRAKVPQLEQHPLIKAKFAASPMKALRQRLWSGLQSHTIEGSKTVKQRLRVGEGMFTSRRTVRGSWWSTFPRTCRRSPSDASSRCST